jgi:DNA-binding NtrC family response regulator
LTQAGYTVVAPEDGLDALGLSKAELDSIDLLVTDVVMPGISGTDLVAHLSKRNLGLKILYVSGHIDHALISSGQLSEKPSLLQKPFTKAQLLQKVQIALNGGARAKGSRLTP